MLLPDNDLRLHVLIRWGCEHRVPLQATRLPGPVRILFIVCSLASPTVIATPSRLATVGASSTPYNAHSTGSTAHSCNATPDPTAERPSNAASTLATPSQPAAAEPTFPFSSTSSDPLTPDR